MRRGMLVLPVLAGVMFGAAGTFVRHLNAAGMSGPTVLFARASFATAFMLAFLLATDRSKQRVSLRDLPIFLGTGPLGMMALNICYNEAIARLTLSLAAVLLCTAPVFVMVFSSVLFRERITTRKVACMVLAILGCVLVSGLLDQGVGVGVSASGVAFGVGAAVFYALYSMFSRIATDRGYHTYTVVLYSVALTTVFVLPFSDVAAIGSYLAGSRAPGALYLCLHALVTSVLPYVFITTSLQAVDPSTVSILASATEPISAMAFGALVYAELPTPLMMLGIVVSVAALVLLTRQPTAAGEQGTGEGRP